MLPSPSQSAEQKARSVFPGRHQNNDHIKQQATAHCQRSSKKGRYYCRSYPEGAQTLFCHRNVSPNEDLLFGTVVYTISCTEGLDMSNQCKGSIEDFYNYGPVIQPNVNKCIELESGLVYTSTYNISQPLNTGEFVHIVDKKSVEILPMDFSMFTDETSYTEVEIHFNEHAVGSYTAGGSVETYLFNEIPRRGADQINSTE